MGTVTSTLSEMSHTLVSLSIQRAHDLTLMRSTNSDSISSDMSSVGE